MVRCWLLSLCRVGGVEEDYGKFNLITFMICCLFVSHAYGGRKCAAYVGKGLASNAVVYLGWRGGSWQYAVYVGAELDGVGSDVCVK